MSEGYESKPLYRFLLWENPHAGNWDPATHGDIILSSGDYDYLEFEMSITGGSNQVTHCHKVGNIASTFTITITNAAISAVGNNFMMGREFTYKSRTQFGITSGFIVRWGESTVGTDNSFAVPQKIYGIKYS